MTHPAHPSRRRLLTGAAGLTGGLLIGGLIRPDAARAAVTPPRVYTRAEWGARPATGAIRYLDRQPDHIVVHHTAGTNVTDYSLAAAYRCSKWIQDLHMDQNGWIDSGQQLTISRGGYVMEGRQLSLRAIREGQHVSGAQTAGHNDHTIGIENEGIYVSAPVPAALFGSLVQTCAWLCQVYDLDPFAAIVGHRDYVATQCPGDVLYARLPELRQKVAAAL
ncbi:N-acetylmuramoyl-L-alanine amidase [Micromonospora pattaloongensis]|uniref:N-acetylmuramoyl-L-alanine amidase n=1 Tax=Micromonospora pattaloongensis TaxID=405436 RepID=A0A1H3FML3_9ACTN|nr:peptidoglycan recognition family protein [Micromonospora pattaloongensis]SDX92282.1 N-acetylmuramoyl-L-alanine amidase [Micromonospora pattaloongensis]